MQRPLLLCVVLAACAHVPPPAAEPPPDSRQDIHSAATPDVKVTHVALDLTLDFAAKVVKGTVELAVAPHQKHTLVLDTKNLVIHEVTGADGGVRAWKLRPTNAKLGEPLEIELRPDDAKVRVAYETTAGAEALQWL